MEALKTALERMVAWVFIGSLVLDTFDKHPDKSLSDFSISYKLAMLFFVSIRWGAVGYSVYSGVAWWALVAVFGDLLMNNGIDWTVVTKYDSLRDEYYPARYNPRTGNFEEVR
jgi:hypothetical protein